MNFIDDHSRLAVASRVLARVTAPAVLQVFREAGARWGLPAALLTDNGCVYTTWHRGGPNVMQTELLALGIDYRHSRPYHPQTCGKVERFHQTMKAFLDKQEPRDRSRSCRPLQRGATASGSWAQTADRRVRDSGQGEAIGSEDPRRGRRACAKGSDRQEREADASSPNAPAPHRVGHAHKGKRVIMLIHDLDVRVISTDGEVLRHFTLDPSRDYQPQGS